MDAALTPTRADEPLTEYRLDVVSTRNCKTRHPYREPRLPKAMASFQPFDEAALADGAIPKKYKELMAVAVGLYQILYGKHIVQRWGDMLAVGRRH